MTAKQKTSAIIAVCMAESILAQVKEYIPGMTKQRLMWFDRAFSRYSEWLNDGRPLSSVSKKLINKFDDIFISVAKSLEKESLSSRVQVMLLIEATNTLLHQVPAHCPGANAEKAWQGLVKHHNAILDMARSTMTAEEVESFESLGNTLYLAVADYMRPENQDALMREGKIAA